MSILSIISSYIAVMLFVGCFAAASVVDLQCRMIPNICSIGLLLVSAIQIVSGTHLLSASVAGLLGVGGLLLVVSVVTDGFGGGDVKLAAAGSAVTGLESGLAAMIITLLFAFAFAGMYRLTTKKRSQSLPLAPFLMIGFCFIYFIVHK